MKLIENYQNALDTIYEHVGYDVKNYTLEIVNRIDMFWKIDGNEVLFAESVDEVECEETVNGFDMFTPTEFHDMKNIYVGKDMTMIFCKNSFGDGNTWMALFDNSKKIQ